MLSLSTLSVLRAWRNKLISISSTLRIVEASLSRVAVVRCRYVVSVTRDIDVAIASAAIKIMTIETIR